MYVSHSWRNQKMTNSIYNKIIQRFRNLELIKRYPTIKELIKYSLVGNLSNALDFGLYFYLTRVFYFWWEHYLVANLFTLFMASLVRFVFHKHWTFRNSDKRIYTQYLKFITILVIGLIFNEFILYISVEHLIFNDLIGKLMAMALGTLLIYYFTRTWVFGKPAITSKNWYKF
jgi:putative flippase GtrA